MRFAGHVFHHVIPALLVLVLRGYRYHLEGILPLFTRTNIHAVAATQAVEHVHLNAESHSGELFSLRFQDLYILAHALLFLFVKHEWADGSMRAHVRALVTLDAILRFPYRHGCRYTSFLVGGGTHFPRTVFSAAECRYRQVIPPLSVDGTHHLANKLRRIVSCIGFGLQRSPFLGHFYLNHVTSTIHSGIVHLHHLFPFSTVG